MGHSLLLMGHSSLLMGHPLLYRWKHETAHSRIITAQIHHHFTLDYCLLNLPDGKRSLWHLFHLFHCTNIFYFPEKLLCCYSYFILSDLKCNLSWYCLIFVFNQGGYAYLTDGPVLKYKHQRKPCNTFLLKNLLMAKGYGLGLQLRSEWTQLISVRILKVRSSNHSLVLLFIELMKPDRQPSRL